MSQENRRKLVKSYIIVILWVAVIAFSFSARDNLTTSIESSSGIIDSDSESTDGSDLYKGRFNITETEDTHILVMQLPEGENFIAPEWRNYSLILTQYLNDSLFERGYKDYYSEAILFSLGFGEFGSALVSEKGNTALLQIVISSDLSEDAEKLGNDVHFIRSLIASENLTDGVYDKAVNLLTIDSLENFMPDREDAEKIEIILTGNSANFVDILETSTESFEKSEILAIIVAIIILSIVFRSPLGIVIPIFAMIASLLPTYLITSYLGNNLGWFSVSDFLPAIIGMIGIAVAIDYNLFSLVRFREEFRKRKADLIHTNSWDRETRLQAQIDAAEKTNRTTGKAVMYSGFTVIIGFLSMLVLGSDFTLGMSISVSIVVAISVLTARTLTPAFLKIFGDKLDWPSFMSGDKKDLEELKTLKIKNNFWVKWSRQVMKRPWLFLVIGLLTMVPFVIVSTETDLAFDFVKQLPPGTDSRDGFEILQREFDFGSINPIQIIVDLGASTNFFADEFSDQAQGILDRIEEFALWAVEFSQEREKDGTLMTFDNVRALSIRGNGEDMVFMNRSTMVGIMSMPSLQQALFVDSISSYVNLANGNNTLRIDVTSPLDPGSAGGWEQMSIIRTKVGEVFGSMDGIDAMYVTGLAALFSDASDEMYAEVPKMLIIATVAIFLALLVLFRSIVLPIKAILTISGSILFGLGSLVMVFQYGWFNEIAIGDFIIWQAEVVGISFFLPTFLFTTILGLGMDYSILIITRIKEEYESSGDMNEAVGIGLSKTAGVITSAATVMIATFLVFASAPMLVLKMMGLAMAVAIVIDATISRIILVPAAMRLMGEYNWWLPKWLEKILPKIDLEH